MTGALLSGWPTAISQRWPACPCAGFKPFAGGAADAAGCKGEACRTGVVLVVAIGEVVDLAAGGLFKGCPTAMSQRCPGLPWAGLRPDAVVDVALTGLAWIAGVEVATGLTAGGAVAAGFNAEVFKTLAVAGMGEPTATSQRWPG